MFGPTDLRETINQDVSKYFYLSIYHAYRRGSTHFDGIKITAIQFPIHDQTHQTPYITMRYGG